MNKLLKKITQVLIITGLILIPQTAKTEVIRESSVLCSNRGLNTHVALSTGQFNAAICSRDYSDLYYVGQNARTNEGVFLPVSESYINDERNAQIFKAVNGSYTYQIFATCHLVRDRNNWASLSVFENGRRLRNNIVDHYMTNVGWCNDFFGYRREDM